MVPTNFYQAVVLEGERFHTRPHFLLGLPPPFPVPDQEERCPRVSHTRTDSEENVCDVRPMDCLPPPTRPQFRDKMRIVPKVIYLLLVNKLCKYYVLIN